MILVKTEAGHLALKERSVRLTPRQRSAFILFDGKRSVHDVLEAGMGIAREDIEQMVELGLLGQVGGSADAANAAAVARPPAPDTPVNAPSTAPTPPQPVSQPLNSGRPSQQRYKDAYPLATQLTGGLGLRGFRLNLSVEGTSTYEELVELLPKIRAAVGPEKVAALELALLG
ncbi:hypothetical protein QTH97_13085 [Variovorax sp. J22R24]|uniref:hypothetical protein n=1 Tax=Variovorax gracilis TaxID=3053502 RepID=UPI0025778587|nr:hypothetical protein [Variovorax sp. J22R24]MDM0105873.1 hypothetical protein [Variovorax sp. J22R24]